MLLPLLLAAAASQPVSLRDFEAALAKNDSATAALRDWCEARAIANPAVIHAERITGPAPRPPAGLRKVLGIPPAEAVGYRHVKLTCGGTVLSEAHNWYVRSRLTGAMNQLLDSTDTPFGKVVAPLGFRREAIRTVAGCDGPCPARTISTHRALLRLPDGRPLALVIEHYTPANLAD